MLVTFVSLLHFVPNDLCDLDRFSPFHLFSASCFLPSTVCRGFSEKEELLVQTVATLQALHFMVLHLTHRVHRSIFIRSRSSCPPLCLGPTGHQVPGAWIPADGTCLPNIASRDSAPESAKCRHPKSRGKRVWAQDQRSLKRKPLKAESARAPLQVLCSFSTFCFMNVWLLHFNGQNCANQKIWRLPWRREHPPIVLHKGKRAT